MDLRKALRTAIVSTLTGDSAMQTLFGGTVALEYRPTRKFISLPHITIFDGGTKADNVVPLYDRTLQVDIWTRSDLDLAEDIAHRVVALLDMPARIASDLGGPFTLDADTGLAAYLTLKTDNDASLEDADLVRKTLTFRVLTYAYNTES